MPLTINISNEQLFDKILWFLNSFKNQGLEIVESRHIDSSKNEILQNLKTSVEEMRLIKEGRLDAVNARDLLDEL